MFGSRRRHASRAEDAHDLAVQLVRPLEHLELERGALPAQLVAKALPQLRAREFVIAGQQAVLGSERLIE